jgi:WD40 repeat protein
VGYQFGEGSRRLPSHRKEGRADNESRQIQNTSPSIGKPAVEARLQSYQSTRKVACLSRSLSLEDTLDRCWTQTGGCRSCGSEYSADSVRNPFNDRVIASGSDDGKVFIWQVPQGFTLYSDDEEPNDVAPVSKLTGHSRYVGESDLGADFI